MVERASLFRKLCLCPIWGLSIVYRKVDVVGVSNDNRLTQWLSLFQVYLMDTGCSYSSALNHTDLTDSGNVDMLLDFLGIVSDDDTSSKWRENAEGTRDWILRSKVDGCLESGIRAVRLPEILDAPFDVGCPEFLSKHVSIFVRTVSSSQRTTLFK